MARRMKAFMVRGQGVAAVENAPWPVAQRGEVVVEVAVAGLCRTDVKLFDIGHRDLVLPRIPAEEVVGTVTEAGDRSSQKWVGKRVHVYPGQSCGRCIPCRRGAENLCRSMRIMGFHRDGGFAEAVAVPASALVELPASLSFEDAVLAEPLSCCLNALELGRLQSDERIGIWGGGTAGTLLARAAASTGAAVTVFERDEARRKKAGGVSEAPPDFQCELAIPAVGSPEAYRVALSHLAPRGRLVAFSGLTGAVSREVLDLNELHYHEQSVIGAYGCSYRHAVEAVELIAAGRIAVKDLVTHRMGLNQLVEAMDLVRKRLAMKILIDPKFS